MPNHGGHRPVAHREDEANDVSDSIEVEKVTGVVVVIEPAACRASVAAEVGSNDMKSCQGQPRHHLSPAVRQLGDPWSRTTHGRLPVLLPASRTCILRPLPLLMKRERMPVGRTAASYGPIASVVGAASCLRHAADLVAITAGARSVARPCIRLRRVRRRS